MSNTTHTISMIVDADNAELLQGELVTYDKPADSGRTVKMRACATCGTKIWNEPPMPIMKAGNLDDLSWAKPIGNIWTASKVPWVEIDPDVPNFEGQPENRDALIAAWAAQGEG